MHTSNVGSIKLDRQDPYLDGQHLDALIELWLADCADRLDELGPNGYTGTTKGYADKISYFREWWAAQGPTCGWRLTRHGLREFERWLRQYESRFGGTLGYHTRNDALRRLRAMFRWAQAEGYIVNVYPADWVPTATGHPPECELVPDSSLRSLLNAATEGSHPVRDLAILAVLIGTGMRRNECASLNIEDVRLRDDCSGEIIIRNPKETRATEGKPLTRHVAIDAAAGLYLKRWLDGCGRLAGPLFPSQRTGKHISGKGLYYAVRRCWERAGLSAEQPCHDLRRKYVTEWRRLHENTADQLLGLQIGHASPKMSDHYALRSVDDILSLASSPMNSIPIAVDTWPAEGTA